MDDGNQNVSVADLILNFLSLGTDSVPLLADKVVDRSVAQDMLFVVLIYNLIVKVAFAHTFDDIILLRNDCHGHIVHHFRGNDFISVLVVVPVSADEFVKSL